MTAASGKAFLGNTEARRRLQARFLLASLIFSAIAAVLWAVHHYTHSSIAIAVPAGSRPVTFDLSRIIRWLALLAFCGYTWTRRSLTIWIFAGMLIGAEIGHDWPHAGANLQILSTIFLRLIRTIVAPLIFGTLVVGIAGHSNLKQVGRMGIKALVYFEVITSLALFIGLAAINLSRAGEGVQQQRGAASVPAPTQQETASDIILKIFPENIAKSVADGQVLQVVVFSIIFAIALAWLSEDKRRPMLAFCESLSEVMFKFTNIVMMFAPVGVAGAMAFTIGTMGLDVLAHLAKLLATLYAALAVLWVGVFLPVAWIARLPIKTFIEAVAEPVSIAFSTASSEAALPRAMENMEQFGAPRQIVAFVLPTGYSFNLDGAALYLSLGAIFVAQAAEIHLSLPQQLVIAFTLMLTSKGVAGVPRASFVILLGTAASFHLPLWPVMAIFGIDQLMDMGRTATNVLGNCLATAVVARWEGQLRISSDSGTAADAVHS